MAETMSPTEILTHEHHEVLGKLERLETIFKSLDHKHTIALELQNLTAFFKTDFWLHFDKEERALFPEFDNFMPHGAGPLAVMREEHNVIRDTNDVLQESVARYLGDGNDAPTRQKIIESGSHFIGYLRSHIAKEDGMFPQLASMHLHDRENARILKGYAEIEKSAK